MQNQYTRQAERAIKYAARMARKLKASIYRNRASPFRTA